MSNLATFPCNLAKEPLSPHGFKSAVRGSSWKGAPLIGVPTGEMNGFDVLDLDGDAGAQWYDQNFDALPFTYAQETPHGLHLFFHHAEGLRCSRSRIAPDVDVRADGGYVIWWRREGLPFEENPICEWPNWLLELAKGKGPPDRAGGDLSKFNPSRCVDVVRAHSRTEALRKLDPVEWRGRHDEWFALLMGAKAAGIAPEDFIAWSVGDPAYAGDAAVISVKWDSVAPRHSGAFFAALRAHGIRVTDPNPTSNRLAEVSLNQRQRPSRSLNPHARFAGLRGKLERARDANREPLLFWSACEAAEMVAEGWPSRKVAELLLLQACKANGLLRDLGTNGCKQTIDNAFAHVKGKPQ
jgi:hypothetical protein